MNTLQNRLKLGFAIYIAGSFTLFLQFFLYLLQSNIASTTDFAGYGYYLVAAFAHAGLFALIPYLLYILMIAGVPFPPFQPRSTDYLLFPVEYHSLPERPGLSAIQIPYQRFGTGHGFRARCRTSVQFRNVFDSQICIDYPGCGIPVFRHNMDSLPLLSAFEKTANYLISRSLCMQHFKCTFSACLCRCFKPIFDTKCRNLPATILSIDCKQVNGKIRNYPSPGFPSATERQHHSQYRYHLSVTSVDFK